MVEKFFHTSRSSVLFPEFISPRGAPGHGKRHPPEYAATRHNAGFWWIDALARELKVQLQPEHGCWSGPRHGQGQALWLLQPQTFMNLLGKSVGALARFFKIQPNKSWWRTTSWTLPRPSQAEKGGSHGGHNGLRHPRPAGQWRLLAAAPGHWPSGQRKRSHQLGAEKKRPATNSRPLKRALPTASKPGRLLVAGAMDKATAQINTNTPPRPKPPRPEVKKES